MFLLFADIFFKINFLKNYFRNTIRVSNSLDLIFIGPDLGPNCLQKLSADDTSRQRVESLASSARHILCRPSNGGIFQVWHSVWSNLIENNHILHILRPYKGSRNTWNYVKSSAISIHSSFYVTTHLSKASNGGIICVYWGFIHHGQSYYQLI